MSVCELSAVNTRILPLIMLICLLASENYGQSKQPIGAADDVVLSQKLSLLSELRGLEARAKQLEKPLARATGEIEIADAVWLLDRDLAKELLRDAYDHTFPSDEEQNKLRNRPIGAPPILPGPLGNARLAVRRHVLEIARRDNKFAEELIRLAIERLGVYEGHLNYASLANDALDRGDNEAARKYILQAIDADPTQIPVSEKIARLAANDRAAADEIILQYISRLNSITLSRRDGSEARVFYLLATLVPFPNANSGPGAVTVSPPGPAVMKAYVSYMLESMSQMDSVGLTATRGFLLNLWPILNQYAPEFRQQFLDLEQRSRKPGENLVLPSKRGLEEDSKVSYEKRIKQELEQEQPDENIIRSAISHGDFSKARKMIDRLDDGSRKTQLLEMVNCQEAISLANKGDLPGARRLAENLAKVIYILRAFPVIAGKCTAKKDSTCAHDVIDQAVRQLKKADATPETPPPGIPASIMPSNKEYDPVLAAMSSLVSAVAPLEDDLALDVLDELVIRANHSELETGLGRTGFESSLFKKLAEKNEDRTTAAAIQLQDPLRQIVALAAIDQWKSDKLAKDAPHVNKSNDSTVRKN